MTDSSEYRDANPHPTAANSPPITPQSAHRPTAAKNDTVPAPAVQEGQRGAKEAVGRPDYHFLFRLHQEAWWEEQAVSNGLAQALQAAIESAPETAWYLKHALRAMERYKAPRQTADPSVVRRLESEIAELRQSNAALLAANIEETARADRAEKYLNQTIGALVGASQEAGKE